MIPIWNRIRSNTREIAKRVVDRAPALAYHDFRMLWFGQLVSMIGSQMQLIAIDWHVFRLLADQSYAFSLFGHTFALDAQALGLGGLGLARIVPILFFALLGGIIADMQDRRTIMLWSQSVSAFFAAVLAALSFTDNATLPALYLLTAIGAAATAFDSPARQALVPNLVAREHFTNAVSLNTILWQFSTILGPAIGGLLISQFNIGVVYALNAVSFIAVIIALLAMHYRGRATPGEVVIGWDSLKEGIAFVLGSRIIFSTMLLDFFATFFASARTMLPIVAGDILRVGPQGYGLLVTAQPIGAFIAGSILALRRDIYRQGVVLLVSVALYGLATALFGLSTMFALSFLLFGITGAADTVSTVIRGTIRQLMTPDRLRGRMTSVNMVFFMGGPQLGEMEAGLVAAAFGAPVAIFTGGIATMVLTGWVAWRYPRLRNYTSDTEQALRAGAAVNA